MGTKVNYNQPLQPLTYRAQAANARAMMYPRLEQLWRRLQPRIDNQIIDFYRGTDAIGEGLTQLQYGISQWFASQNLDADTLVELQLAGQDPEYFEACLSERVNYLREKGKLGRSAVSPLVAPQLLRRKPPVSSALTLKPQERAERAKQDLASFAAQDAGSQLPRVDPY